MDRARYERLKDVFNAACDAAPAARGAAIEALCEGDVELRREVEAMLAEVEAPGIDLDAAASGIAVEWGEALRHTGVGRPIGAGMPERIGEFALVGVLGQGGMGVVYLAQQEKPARQVALKLIRPDLTSSDVMRRFDRETAALGRLQHPGIAQIFEAGVAQVGGTAQPYIAMEYVRGRTLLKYAEEEKLGTRARLGLMEKIARAVEYAHQQGVIHRDLKPANIIVDERGQPRILDFGIARTTDESAMTQTLRTGVGQLVGTLPYMSPEQVSGDPSAIDTRADVYALGVICFELLTGRAPIEVNDRSIPEAVRRITEGEPTRLGSVDRTLRGDLDTIAAKALEHDKGQRYASAGALAEDVRRFLADEPILARPASAMYQLRKLARRNRALVMGTAAVLMVLIAGLIASVWGWMHALDQRGVAEREASRARQVSAFMQGILAGVDPDVAKTMDTKLLERLLDEASANIDEGLRGQPEVEAEVRLTIGRTFHNAGLDARAEPHLRRAVELRTSTVGGDSMVTAEAKAALAGALMDMGRLEEAEPLLLDWLAVSEAAQDDEQRFLAMNNLGDLYVAVRRVDEADEMFTSALAIGERRDAVSEHQELLVMNNLAALRIDQGRIEEARALREEVYARRLENDGAGDPHTNVALNNLAFFYDHYGPQEKVLPMYEAALANAKAYYGARHPRTLMPMNNVANELVSVGRLEEAKACFDELVSAVEAAQGSPLFAAAVHKNASGVYLRLGEAERAEALARRCVEIASGFGAEHPIRRIAGMALGEALTALKRYEEAERVLLEVQELIEANMPEGKMDESAMRLLVSMYEGWGRAEDAEKWQAKLGSSAGMAGGQ